MTLVTRPLVPWPDVDQSSSYYSDRTLAREAKLAVKEHPGGELLDWRIILDRYGDCTLQVRYKVGETMHYTNVAL